MIFTTRDLDILRFLRWCRFVLAEDLTGVFSKAEVQNLEILRLVKLYSPAQAYTLTAAGNRLLDAAFPKLPAAVAPAYKAADTLRRIRQAKLMTTAYQAGVSVFTTDISALCEQAMFLPMIARNRGSNPWGSTRVAALLHTGNLMCAIHWVSPGIGCVALTDELTAFQNHTASIPAKQRAMIFAASSYEEILSELDTVQEKQNTRLQTYREVYIWFSGYKYTHDPRGFDILPDGTHGTSGFLTEKEMREFLELSPAGKTEGMILGKVKKHPDDPDAYALYAAHRMVAGDNNNLLCIGAPGSGKSRGFIIPFLMGCAKRGESAFITDAKGELFERLSPYFRQHGFYVKAVNFLDMEHSDGWNCLYGLDTQPQLVQTVANTIVQNTSGPKEANDFWSRAELNLLMALIHYVVNLRDANGNLLPIEQRGLGDVYRMIATESIEEINRKLEALPPEHPAKYPHGLFLKAKENL